MAEMNGDVLGRLLQEVFSVPDGRAGGAEAAEVVNPYSVPGRVPPGIAEGVPSDAVCSTGSQALSSVSQVNIRSPACVRSKL